MSGRSLLIIPATVEADIVACREGLSFWGGVDPETGRVIDAHHELNGICLAGKIVLMPTSRGSCSGSGVLLQLALNGQAPKALIFRENEEVLTLGAVIASHMFDKAIGVARISAADYDALSLKSRARFDGGGICSEELEIDLHTTPPDALRLTANDRAVLEGCEGEAASLAMRVICAMAAAQGATRLVNICRGHIDGCIYAHDANLIFAETMAQMGAQVKIPTTINAISVDEENWPKHNLPLDFGEAATRLAGSYVQMGARPTFTCAPYLSDDVPRFGEEIAWSESNAVIFANSVLGARTAKHPDYLDLFIAVTGRAPETGVYLTQNRRPGVIIDVDVPAGFDDSFWPLVGWIAGHLASDRVPLLTGLEPAAPSRDDLRAVCAAFGTTSAAPLLHVSGVTPESDLAPLEDADRVSITRASLFDAWRTLNTGSAQIDLIALGSPHFSLEETRLFADLLGEMQINTKVSVMITLGRDVYAKANSEGLVDRLQALGVQIHKDLCWCSMIEPLFPVSARTVMTNSGKYAHYAPGLSGREVRFGSLADCAAAAKSAIAPMKVPSWLIV